MVLGALWLGLSAWPAGKLAATPSVSPSAAEALPSAPVDSVFHIEKSHNRNQVHYAVKVDAACRPLGARPVWGYWREFEVGPRATSHILPHEQQAYGVQEGAAVQLGPNWGRVRINLRGFPQRPLVIDTFRQGSGCAARALTSIAGQPALLRSIYVKIGFLFSVEYALARGLRSSDGKPVEEKLPGPG
jgi:hypothetical protein